MDPVVVFNPSNVPIFVEKTFDFIEAGGWHCVKDQTLVQDLIDSGRVILKDVPSTAESNMNPRAILVFRKLAREKARVRPVPPVEKPPVGPRTLDTAEVAADQTVRSDTLVGDTALDTATADVTKPAARSRKKGKSAKQ